MKQFLLLTLAVIGCNLSTIAQTESNYHSFLKEGKVWNCCLDGEHGMEENEGAIYRYVQTTFYSLSISGDTVVGDKTYKKMYKKPTLVVREYYSPQEMSGKKDTLSQTGESDLWDELWREEDQKVYVYLQGGEVLRYDFSAESGSTVDISGVATDMLSVDTIHLFGKPLRRFNVALHSYPEAGIRYWIEGVGHPGGPFRVWGAEVNDGCSYQLLSCYEDGECIYSAEEYEKQNQTENIVHPSATQHSASVFDLQGRRILDNPKHGVYIQNGKKILK